MTDVLPTDQIDFEEPPSIARRSEHLPLLLALKGAPGRSARVKKDEALDEKASTLLASAVRLAASKIGNGYKVVTRFIPADDRYGVWVSYEPVAGDEPMTVDEAMPDARRRLITDATVLDVSMVPGGQGSIAAADDDDLDPIGDDDGAWETAERQAVAR